MILYGRADPIGSMHGESALVMFVLGLNCGPMGLPESATGGLPYWAFGAKEG